MALTFLLDEHLRGMLWTAIQRHNKLGIDLIDAICVGDPSDLPFSVSDSDILTWAEANDRILVSRDVRTLVNYFHDHLDNGRHSPGILLLLRQCTIPNVVATLALIANAGEKEDFADQIQYIS